jgi:hypothetical protein
VTTVTLPELALKTRVLAILEHHHGRANAIKGMEIAELVGLCDDRAVQQAIEELIIKDEQPIAASCRKPMGYFMPETYEEARDYDRQLRSRLIGDNNRRVAFNRGFARRYEGMSRLRLL